MRTTLVIDDDLYREVKSMAALQGETVTSLVEQALRELIAAELRDPRDIQPLSYLEPMGEPCGEIDLDDNSAVLDVLDSDSERFTP
jgi:hypothetical protein